ncbi:helix-turn-helix domain-containing protein [Methylomonas albis]|uniref:Helix-turn-helix domain-containing protein n=1 Tax=Methylomonas albis TaxID=1854563 RepID=A0ABR9D6L9_9GAMM|nr:helix-turn-helix transcriptional regulator [Methylomonas albis]MBD9358775.1 helix-turn-helix domain-containing protein [Methylomonas albis]CAD6882233.1 helix-turn-helix domain-containing protein [Methylomonas albis]
MSPFSHLLQAIRASRGICQSELSDLIGYEQTYISSLETGRKGPPPQAFIDRLAKVLNLSADEHAQLVEAADASNRKVIIEKEVPLDVYWLFSDLRKHQLDLSPFQVRMIREFILLKETLAAQPEYPVQKIRRRKNREVHM